MDKHEISIVLAGEAGQGIKTIEYLLTNILKQAGFYVFSTKEYMSRVRGGCNSTEIRIANYPIHEYVSRIDIALPFSKEAVLHLKPLLTKNTLIIGSKELKLKNQKHLIADFAKIAQELGDKVYSNSAAIGYLLGLLQIKQNFYQDFFGKYFAEKGKDISKKNIAAADYGYKLAEETTKQNRIKIKLTNKPKDLLLFNGAEAIALGAIAGGCDFIASYPMSPSTGVLTQLAAYSREFAIIVEQAEDEIAAINMGLGAWYAGARAMVTTSGGGFALMSEGISLAGMTETPMVIHLGQRPGPATGLPTRTEQGDLNLVLHAGHGEFPRIILAPGSPEQAFHLTQKVFYFADKFQVPVFILTDQYFLDSYMIAEPFKINQKTLAENHIIKTDKKYLRYRLTKDGISPRGIPDFGTGIVCVDSDEHTEGGYITEDFTTRINMVEKRLQKFTAINKEIIAPEFFGGKQYKHLLVCWGSNYYIAKAALAAIGRGDIALLHYSQLYPLAKKTAKYFANAKKVFVIENNATAQFAELLRKELNVTIDNTILKYNGLPFSVEELATLITKRI